jgi:hypothetical protein
MKGHPMTSRRFDVHTSNPQFASVKHDRRRRMVRVAWLLRQFVQRKPVYYEAYFSHFGRSMHSFDCDLTVLRRARISRGGKPLVS